MAEIFNFDNERVMALVAGRPGHGKTAMEASFPGPIKIYDFDHRAEGLRGCQWLRGKEIAVERHTDPIKTVEQLVKDCTAYKAGGKAPATIIIDSLNTLAMAMMAESMLYTGGRKLDRMVGNSKTYSTFELATPGDYNYAQTSMHKLFYNYLLPLKSHVLISAWIVDVHERPEGKPFAEAVITGERLLTTNKIAEAFPGYFSEVWKVEKTEVSKGNMPPKYEVLFWGQLCKTSFDVSGLDRGRLNITGKPFYEEFMEKVRKVQK